MNLKYFSSAAYRVLTTPTSGPTLYDLCDPVLRSSSSGDEHLLKFYKTALANLALRPLLSRAGLPQLRDEELFRRLQGTLLAARELSKLKNEDLDRVLRLLAAMREPRTANENGDSS